MKRREVIMKSGIIVDIVFLIMGFAIMMGGIVWIIDNIIFFNSAVEINATISDIITIDEDNETAFVTYEFDGTLYKDISLHYSSSSMYVGDRIKIYCNPKNPKDIKSMGGDVLVSIILVIMGIGFICLSGVSMHEKLKPWRWWRYQ